MSVSYLFIVHIILTTSRNEQQAVGSGNVARDVYCCFSTQQLRRILIVKSCAGVRILLAEADCFVSAQLNLEGRWLLRSLRIHLVWLKLQECFTIVTRIELDLNCAHICTFLIIGALFVISTFITWVPFPFDFFFLLSVLFVKQPDFGLALG